MEKAPYISIKRKEGKKRKQACRTHASRTLRAALHGRAFLCLSLGKEVIQPHFPVRLPCYDFTLLTKHTFDGAPLAVGLPASGILYSDGVTGGVYKARERIHRAVLMRDY